MILAAAAARGLIKRSEDCTRTLKQLLSKVLSFLSIVMHLLPAWVREWQLCKRQVSLPFIAGFAVPWRAVITRTYGLA